MIQYEKFNESKFEAYCKKCIDNAVLKERQRKAVMGKTELSFSDLTDSLLQTLTQKRGCSSSQDFRAGAFMQTAPEQRPRHAVDR